MRKNILLFLFVNLLFINLSWAGARGYYAALVDISEKNNQDGIDRVLTIRTNTQNSTLIKNCILCSQDAQIAILFIKKTPSEFTPELLRKVAKKDPEAIKTVQKALRDFQDKDVVGLDGVFLYEKKDKTVFVYGLGVSPRAKLVVKQKTFQNFLSDNSLDVLFQGAAKSLETDFVP